MLPDEEGEFRGTGGFTRTDSQLSRKRRRCRSAARPGRPGEL